MSRALRRMNRRLEIAVVASVALHLAVLAWVGGVLRHPAPAPATPDTRPMIELRLVEQQGAGETNAGARSAAPIMPPPAASAPEPATAPQAAAASQAVAKSRKTSAAPSNPPRNALPSTAAENSGLDVPAAPAPEPPDREEQAPLETARADPTPAAPTPAASLQMNLGGTESESNALASGPGVIPAGLDQRARNRPPVYPQEAARRGQQGAVVLLIHVAPDGAATGSDVLETSGYESLDRAAQQAVATWRFRPGLKEGQPVASDMPMRFVFEFN